MPRVNLKNRFPKLKKKVQTGAFTSLVQAGATVRKIAKNSIKKAKLKPPAPLKPGETAPARKGRPETIPSRPGTPPNTRNGQIKRALRYEVMKRRQMATGVAVGVLPEEMGKSLKAHEGGGDYRGANYPKRPLLVPALAKVKSRIPSFWTATVKE